MPTPPSQLPTKPKKDKCNSPECAKKNSSSSNEGEPACKTHHAKSG